jgi:hypothetical protein
MDSSGVFRDSGGAVLTPEQVTGQVRLNCQLDSSYCAGGTNDPTKPGAALADVGVMPTCTGATVAVCTSLLDAAGFSGARTFTPADLDGADLTKPAGAVITQPHPASTSVPKSDSLTFTVNPDDMPFELPKPGRNETYAGYVDRLRALGWLGTVTYVDLTELSANTELGPDAVARISLPSIGTHVGVLVPGYPWPFAPPHPSPLPTPLPTPQPAPRVPKDVPITITRNPPSQLPIPGPTGAPIPADELPPDGPDTPGGGGGGSPTPGSGGPIDFTPITGLDFGCKFPFGLFCYAKDVTNWFRVTPQAPEFSFTFPSIGGHAIPGGGTYDVNLGDVGAGTGSLDHYMSLWRDLLSVVLWVGAVWMLASRLLGLQLGDPGEAMDDA